MSSAATVKKVVTIIPQRIQPITQSPINSLLRKKVAGYARVSTGSDEQENSYEAQVDYFTEYIRSHEDWEFVKIYTDEGITGTSTKHRDGFNQMISDALAGKIDLIVTKSVSRFARNTVDTLTTIRKLKENGVEVFFQKENIYTFDSKGELLLTIMSSLAQEESRSISENVTWGIRKSFSDGKVLMPYGSFLGYRKGEDGPEIDPDEAEVVKMIYSRFMEGDSAYQIARELTEAGIRTPGGKVNWSKTTVQSILTNEKYTGDAILQKTFCTDFLTKKHKKNEGEVPQYHVQNSHPAIISKELFELVQLEIQARKQAGNKYSGKGLFSGRIVCGQCGGYFGSKVWHSTDAYRKVIWRCNRKYDPSRPKSQRCTTPHVTGDEIKEGFIEAMRQVIAGKEFVLATCQSVLDDLLATEELQKRLDTLQNQLQGLTQRIRAMVTEYSRVTKDKDEFDAQYSALDQQHQKLVKRITAIQQEIADREYRAKQISLFMQMLAKQSDCLEFDPKLFSAFIDHVVVDGEKKNYRLNYVFRDGTEYSVEHRSMRKKAG